MKKVPHSELWQTNQSVAQPFALWVKFSADVILIFFPENRFWHFMQTVSKRNNLYEMSRPFSLKKEKYQSDVCWISPEIGKGYFNLLNINLLNWNNSKWYLEYIYIFFFFLIFPEKGLKFHSKGLHKRWFECNAKLFIFSDIPVHETWSNVCHLLIQPVER